MNAALVLDNDHFRNMTGDDTALQAEIVALFRGQAPLWERLLTPDAPIHTWRDTLHTVKGSARGLGLWRLAEACEIAEIATQACAPDSRTIGHELARVRAALSEALTALPEFPANDEN
jgi:HPt (histidine-containing phosphotransfer) domain-containing protein